MKIWGVGDRRELVEMERLELTDEATCACFSPAGHYLAVALIDNSIKVLDSKSKKLRLNLYAHNLPVLAFDISSDDALLVSGGVDKNVKIWGLDFGDVHRSIFAHGEPISALRFVKDTHYFFSCGKDGLVKYFDADSVSKELNLVRGGDGV